MNDEVVWLTEYRRFALLVQRNAYWSVVRYFANGNEYEIEVMNDEYELWSERSLDYE